jgi:uncharacterized membrane protein (UPF0127 family)
MGKCGTAVILAWLAQAASADCAPGSVELRGSNGATMRFSVEIADDEAERELGLMNRDNMASSSGMLFVYDQPHHAYFWMKNTLIPLDMIFADATGRVQVVHSGAKPMDETPIDGGPDVTYVLEINGGLAAPLGIAPGGVLRADILDQAQAIWACEAK